MIVGFFGILGIVFKDISFLIFFLLVEVFFDVEFVNGYFYNVSLILMVIFFIIILFVVI